MPEFSGACTLARLLNALIGSWALAERASAQLWKGEKPCLWMSAELVEQVEVVGKSHSSPCALFLLLRAR